MGGFGNIARNLGQASTDVWDANQALAAQKMQQQKDQLDLLKSNLDLQQIKQQIANQSPEGQKSTAQAKADIDYANAVRLHAVQSGWAQTDAQNALNFINQGTTPEDKAMRASALGIAPPAALKPQAPEVKSFGGFDWQYDPDGSFSATLQAQGQKIVRMGPYVQLGPTQQTYTNENKPTPPPKYTDVHQGQDGNWYGLNNGRMEQIPAPKGADKLNTNPAANPQSVDDLVMAVAARKAAMPTGVLGAVVAQRAAQMGITLPDVKGTGILDKIFDWFNSAGQATPPVPPPGFTLNQPNGR